MCMNGLKEKELQDTICEELDCGQAEKTVDYFGPKPAGGRVISQLNCSTDDAKSLSACPPVFKNDICTLAGLQCKSRCLIFFFLFLIIPIYCHNSIYFERDVVKGKDNTKKKLNSEWVLFFKSLPVKELYNLRKYCMFINIFVGKD